MRKKALECVKFSAYNSPTSTFIEDLFNMPKQGNRKTFQNEKKSYQLKLSFCLIMYQVMKTWGVALQFHACLSSALDIGE